VKQAKVPLVLSDITYDSDFQHKKPRMFAIFLVEFTLARGVLDLSVGLVLTINANLQAPRQISVLTNLVHLKLLCGITLTLVNL
jgi:hypothetical protein